MFFSHGRLTAQTSTFRLGEPASGPELLSGAWNMRTAKYSALITDAVDEGLGMLGKLPKKAIYEALETDFNMRKKDIPIRFAEFSSILIENIGSGTKPVLEHIVERFSSGIHDKTLPYIDLDESIKRVDTILKDSQHPQEKRSRTMPTDGSS